MFKSYDARVKLAGDLALTAVTIGATVATSGASPAVVIGTRIALAIAWQARQSWNQHQAVQVLVETIENK